MKALPITLLFAILAFASLGRAAEKGWSRLTGCRWMENPANDGDSFHVNYQGKEFIFRLYFVDTCESHNQIPTRVQEQADQLHITTAEVLKAGEIAAVVTHRQLAGKSFTIVTRWQDAKGASRLPRYFAFVLYGADDTCDLASTLTQNGLVRIYGARAEPPGKMNAAQYSAELAKLEADAKRRRLGVYGNLSAADTPLLEPDQGSVVSHNTISSGYVPRSYLLPSALHTPQIVDDPGDELVSEFAVDTAKAPIVVQTGIPEGNYSEIPGWKPPAHKPSSTPHPQVAEPDEVPD